jgi:hypothetical protein
MTSKELMAMDMLLNPNSPEPNSEDYKEITKKLTNAYDAEKLRLLLEKVEDWILTVRKIKIEPEHFLILHRELMRRNFSPSQMSMATLWIKFGKWPISKKDIELSDFYPTREQIIHLESEFVSREYMNKRLQAQKTEFEIEVSKLRYELGENRLNESEIQQYMTGIQRITDLHSEIDRLKRELLAVIKKNTLLEYQIQEKKEIIESIKPTKI